jgi:hypothetical protein
LAILACLVPFAGITTYDAERAQNGSHRALTRF